MKLILFISTLIVFVGCSNFKTENQPTTAQTGKIIPKREIASVESDEVVLKGSKTWWRSCSMYMGYAADSTVITLLQNKNMFFRIHKGNGYFMPEVVILKSDSKGMSKSNKVYYGSDCWNIKKCIDQFGSDELGVASRCSEIGEFSAEFYKP